MEVHHHAHHEGKKSWKSYFWEFLMLFLAVFCGFLAEYQLEHRIEKERASELAHSFYLELKTDSITASLKVRNRIKQEAALEYLINYFRDSSLTNTSKTFALNFQFGLTFRSPTLFEPRTIILDQLRNSGSLRYFKNEDFQRLTGDLTVAIRNVYDRQELESQNRLQYINPLIILHNDYEFSNRVRKEAKNIFDGFTEYEKNNKIIPFHLNSVEKIDRQNIINILSFYNYSVVNSTREVHIQKYIEINAELMSVLRNEYHLK
ncbi:hypothetical protein BH11BAC2_BH11BAC2_02320 [soil metagenome]